ncbi:single-stranded DNA-binding protein [bacterium]|nr:single-stranded DNA-binding protein [bacterium]
MYNKAFLIGRLVRDPEMRVTSSGIAVTNFTIAVDRIKRRGEAEKTADFIRIVAWRRLAEICGEYMKKGKLVAVEGRLQISSYEKDGEKIYTSEIVADTVQMLDRGGAPESEMVGSGAMGEVGF